MTADDRTPSTREARSMYDAGSSLYRETPEQHYLGAPAPDYGAEFDRFLARVRRAAKAEAWREYAAALEAVPDYTPTEYDQGRVDQRHATAEELHVRATEYETGDSDEHR